jgi:uncharacterized RmlC-like cupin family protein
MTGSHDHTHVIHSHDQADRWKHDGVRVIPGDQLDPNVPSTPGMDRKAAINFARAGAQKLWAGTVTIKPDAKTGAHHHGHLESIIYVVKGKARMRWGEHLQFTAEANPGDFIFIPPYVPHQEINASRDEVQSRHRAGGKAGDGAVDRSRAPRSGGKEVTKSFQGASKMRPRNLDVPGSTLCVAAE